MAAMTEALRNVVVIGGSYVGLAAAKDLASVLPVTHRVLLVEPHSHFNHLFAFPRFAIVPKVEHKAFIPYSAVFSASPDPSRHAVVQAKVVSLQPTKVVLDREWQGSRDIPYDFLVVASGTRLAPPGSMPHDDKEPAAAYLRDYQEGLKRAHSILVIGGGAVGVQMACDLKEVYPEKDITLAHSRDKLMPLYHEEMSDLIKARFQELGVNLVTGSHVVVPEGGFPTDGKPFQVDLKDGRKLTTEYAVLATGQIPNTGFLSGLEPSETGSLINPMNGFIRVRPNLQFLDPKYPNLFAVGDIADTGAHKAARPGRVQASAAATNIAAMIAGKDLTEEIAIAPPGIHLTLGLKKNVIFRNPDPKEGRNEPMIRWKDDGEEDMGIERVWERHGVKVVTPQDFHL